MISYAKLPFEYDLNAIQQELEQIQYDWIPHMNLKCYEGEWTVMALHSPGGTCETVYADSIHNKAYADTPLMKQFSNVKNLLTQLQCETMSVRFLKLNAGSVIKKHRDNELAFEQGFARVHFPIITNPSVSFYLDDELVKMQEGETWYINANLPHSVANNGDTHRIHLVIDCIVNDWIKELFDRGEKRIKEPTVNVQEMQKIIAELRLQNTNTSLNLANQLSEQLINHTAKI
jgi:mannose-6-phosphate isomerase-like protein (cupin superfamily)